MQTLDDDLLVLLAREARAANLDVRTAQARVAEARARARVAGAALRPTLTASASSGISGTTVDRPGDDAVRNSAGIDASWEIDAFGRTRSLRDAALLDVDATLANLDDILRLVATEAARLHVEARRIQARRLAVEEAITVQTELLELARMARDTGLGDEREVLQARAALERSLSQLPALDAALEQTALALDALLGAQPGTTAPRLAASPGAALSTATAPALPSPGVLIDSRPDVRTAELRAEAEVARLAAARAARYPTFRLSGSLGVEALTQLSIGSGAGAAYSLLAGMTAPLFAGGRLRAQVEQQDAAVSLAWIAYEAVVLGALVEVERALSAYRAADAQLVDIEQIATTTNESGMLVGDQFDAGLVGFDVVLDAESARVTVRESLVDAAWDRSAAFVALCGAIGNDDVPDGGSIATTEDR